MDRGLQEIRIRMEKGFLRGLPAAFAAAILLAGLSLCFPPAEAGPGGSPFGDSAWWEVRLLVTAEGEYAVRGGRSPVSGEYACRARWEGRLEPDGDDFLLIHVKTEVLDWRLRETSDPAGRESVLEAPAAPAPELRMRYVLKDGREIEFVFEIGGIPIPLHKSVLAVDLELPRSSGRTAGPPGQGYGDFVCRGSSRVVIPESDLLERAPQRNFSWDWRREKRYFRQGRAFFVTQGHTAKTAVSLIAH